MWPAAVATREFAAAVGERERLHPGDAAPVRHPGVGDRRDAARRREAGRRDGPTWRSRPACAAARSRSWCATSRLRSRRSSGLRDVIVERHADTLFSLDGSTVDDQVAHAAARPLGRRGRVVHGRPAGGAADAAAGVVGVLRGRRRVVLERGEGVAAGRRPGADRALRRGVARGGRRDGRGRARSASRPTPRSRSPASRVRAAAPRPSRSGYVCWCVKLADGTTLARDTRLPGDRNEVRDRSVAIGDAPAAAGAPWRGKPRLGPRPVRRARPARRGARERIVAWQDEVLRRARPRRAARAAGVAARDARVPRPPSGGGDRPDRGGGVLAAGRHRRARARRRSRSSRSRRAGRGCGRSTSRTRAGASDRRARGRGGAARRRRLVRAREARRSGRTSRSRACARTRERRASRPTRRSRGVPHAGGRPLPVPPVAGRAPTTRPSPA